MFVSPIATFCLIFPSYCCSARDLCTGRQTLTSSNLKAIIETALKTASVDPVIVVIRSGQDPSEMVIRAVL